MQLLRRANNDRFYVHVVHKKSISCWVSDYGNHQDKVVTFEPYIEKRIQMTYSEATVVSGILKRSKVPLQVSLVPVVSLR